MNKKVLEVIDTEIGLILYIIKLLVKRSYTLYSIQVYGSNFSFFLTGIDDFVRFGIAVKKCSTLFHRYLL